MREGQAGQSTVEFGISAIVLLLLLLGLIDFGRVFYFVVGLQGATREGARQATWFDASAGTNPYLYDASIKSAVDGILINSGLPASQLQNPGSTCPSVADGNASYNPPYAASAYPASAFNQPLLYICYAGTPGLDIDAAPADNSNKGRDVNVILVMSYGLASGFMQGVLGTSIHLATNTHMTVGGY
jgi:Flp pilus assembly protein TadG